MLNAFGKSLYARADRLNTQHLKGLLAGVPSTPDVLDLGCGDGRVTREVTAHLPGARVRAIEGHEPNRKLACSLGIDAMLGDLEARLPFGDDAMDVVMSNQVIEHLADTDNFVAETYRVLRPGGLAVLSTENLASWHNIGALVLGFQPFSSSNYSRQRYPLGNPIALHANENSMILDGMLHRRIFTTRALKELFQAHGFTVVAVRGSGYYPLPPAFGNFDVAHAHFICLGARKAT